MRIELLKQMSRTDKVYLAKNNEGELVVLKKYRDMSSRKLEMTILNQLSISGYAPMVVEQGSDYIIYEYIEGDSFLDKYINYTMTDDNAGLIRLANELSVFLQIFYSLAEGYIIQDINFVNFIIKDGRCYGVDYDSVGEGMQYTDVAGVVAYAVKHVVGDIHDCFPFIQQMLKNFHMQMIDIINDIKEVLLKSNNSHYVEHVLSTLIMIDDEIADDLGSVEICL